MGYNSNIQRDDWECDEMFTNENLKRLILPLVVEQILAVTIGMSDTIMVSSAVSYTHLTLPTTERV